MVQHLEIICICSEMSTILSKVYKVSFVFTLNVSPWLRLSHMGPWDYLGTYYKI